MKRRLVFALAMALSTVLLASVPASAVPGTILIGSCRAQGDFATCVASGTARHHPLRIVVHVKSFPRQHVHGAWSMTCAKGFGAGSTRGHYRSGTPFTRVLRKPYRHPDSCSVAADGQLGRRGHLHIWLTYTN